MYQTFQGNLLNYEMEWYYKVRTKWEKVNSLSVYTVCRVYSLRGKFSTTDLQASNLFKLSVCQQWFKGFPITWSKAYQEGPSREINRNSRGSSPSFQKYSFCPAAFAVTLIFDTIFLLLVESQKAGEERATRNWYI